MLPEDAIRYTAERRRVLVAMLEQVAAHEGPRSAQQIILRGATFGETVVTWRLARVTQDVERTLDAHSEIGVDSRAQPLPGGP